jgi:hypothetical protein
MVDSYHSEKQQFSGFFFGGEFFGKLTPGKLIPFGTCPKSKENTSFFVFPVFPFVKTVGFITFYDGPR